MRGTSRLGFLFFIIGSQYAFMRKLRNNVKTTPLDIIDPISYRKRIKKIRTNIGF